jgi:hypothetical protein
MDKPHAYIAGPMRGRDHSNFPAFDRAAARLRAAGFVVVNPAEMDRVLEGWSETPPEGYSPNLEDMKRFIRRDLLAIMEFDPDRGDLVYLLDGWDESAGAQVEASLGVFLGLRVVEEGGKL